MDMNRRNLLSGMSALFGAAACPALVQANTGEALLSKLKHDDTGRSFVPSKPSLVALFMTAQTMYASCGELFLYADAEVDEIRGGTRNIDKVLIMPPRSAQLSPSENRNVDSARASGFTVLTADLNTVLDVSNRIAGRSVFALEGGKISGHSQKAFFYQLDRASGFEFDPTENPFENDLYQGLRQYL